jgi:hypothetical protein
MTRNKPKDYNLIRKQILELCVEPKSLSELTELLNVDKNIPYRAITHLIDGHCVVAENFDKVKKFKTVSFDYVPPVPKSNYKPKEVHTPSLGGRIYTLDAPFNRDKDSYQTRHLESQRLRDSERRSSRTHVGISSIYNND